MYMNCGWHRSSMCAIGGGTFCLDVTYKQCNIIESPQRMSHSTIPQPQNRPYHNLRICINLRLDIGPQPHHIRIWNHSINRPSSHPHVRLRKTLTSEWDNLRRNHPRDALLPVAPPEQIRQSRPEAGILPSTCCRWMDRQHERQPPPLFLLPRLRIEVG